MHEFADFIGHSRTGGREEITVLNTDCLFQQGIDSLFVELVLQMKHQRRRLTHTQVINVMHLAYFDGVQHHCFPQSGFLRNLFLYARINLLPETGNAAHQCRTHFLDSSLNIRRTKIDTNLYPSMNTEISPGFLKHMRQRKEVHGYILIRHGGQTNIMDTDSLPVIEVV